MTMNAVIESKMPELRALCEKYHVARLELFGSATTDEWNPQTSDFDFLVTFTPPSPPMTGFDQYMGLLLDLQAILERKVDLLEECAMKNRYLIRRVNETRKPLYVAA